MVQKIDYSFDLSTVNVADIPYMLIETHTKTCHFRRIPTVIKQYLISMQNSNQKHTKFTNSNKTVSVRKFRTVIKQYLNSVQTVFKTVFKQYVIGIRE